jgi:hypothetical protein
LIFPDHTTPKKVIFNPRVDMFELLQVNGLFDYVAQSSKSDVRMFAMSNGVISRPIVNSSLYSDHSIVNQEYQ